MIYPQHIIWLGVIIASIQLQNSNEMKTNIKKLPVHSTKNVCFSPVDVVNFFQLIFVTIYKLALFWLLSTSHFQGRLNLENLYFG